MKTIARKPVLFAAGAFALTVGLARFFSYVSPRFHVQLGPGFHLHHYVIGIFLLAIAGYLALVFKGPRATFWIALLYALGIGLTFDEYGLWINPPFVRGVRWNTTGLLIVGFAFVVIAFVRALTKRSHSSSSES